MLHFCEEYETNTPGKQIAYHARNHMINNLLKIKTPHKV